MIDAEFIGLTDMGCVRTNNEDSFQAMGLDYGRRILAVAIDGVGGYEGGEVAAEIARDTITSVVVSHPDASIVDAMMHANNAIVEQRRYRPTLSQMSCVATAVVADLEAERFTFAHIGDSRLYQFVPGAEKPLTKLSHDQSLVGYQEEQGILTEYEAMHHPQRNVISQVLGQQWLTPADNPDFVDTAEYPIIPDSTLLLCSDGLSDMIDSQAITAILANTGLSLEQKAQSLIDSAKTAGGRDNVTVVLVHFASEELDLVDDDEEEEMNIDIDTYDDSDVLIELNTDSDLPEEEDVVHVAEEEAAAEESLVSAPEVNTDAAAAEEHDTSMATAISVLLGLTTVATMLTVIALIV